MTFAALRVTGAAAVLAATFLLVKSGAFVPIYGPPGGDDASRGSQALEDARDLQRPAGKPAAASPPGAPERATDIPEEERVVAVIEAEVTRVSRPLTLEDIVPYRQACICIEYAVKKVIQGTLPKGRVMTVHFAMEDGRLLPPASFKVGNSHRLRLGAWQAQELYQTYPMADEIAGYDDSLYFVFEASAVGAAP